MIPETCTRLIGPHYALLRQEFAELRDASLERRKTPKLERILITLGGVDQNNVTAQVLDALAQSSLPPETELDIVMGRPPRHLFRFDGKQRRSLTELLSA